MIMFGWKAHTEGELRHSWPLNDLREHNLCGALCDCDPRPELVLDGDGTRACVLINHNSFDGREMREPDYSRGRVIA